MGKRQTERKRERERVEHVQGMGIPNLYYNKDCVVSINSNINRENTKDVQSNLS